ncbi:MAG: TatD family hydrolase [Bacteroidales bacterium]|nr:TatD family hydrolase [Bacteroidales bacterium]
MNLIDTHTHLFVTEFDKDRYEVINNAFNAGVSKMILPGINSSYINIQLQMTEAFPGICFPAAGLHPSDVNKDFEEELIIVENNIETGKFIAVGEIGIDLYWDQTFKEEQKIAFEKQIILAKKYQLPVIIHVRDSFSEIFEITDKHNDENLTGIFHSFTGTKEDAEKIINYSGFKIGINGIVTFKNSGLDKVVKKIEMKHLVLETDSPYLSPVPKRGKRNESANLIYIAEKIAEIKEISLEKVAKITNQNALEVFGKNLFKS